MTDLKVQFLKETLLYDGTQLSPLWIYKNVDLRGNAIVSFVGPCDVKLSNMVDMEDIKSKSPIYSESMVHFIAEFFDLDLEKTVYRQRLLMVIMKEILEKKMSKTLTRYGDDIYDGPKKLSVSIATLTTTSTLIHAGVNISSKNTPVLTIGLEEYDISPEVFSTEVLERFRVEMESSWLARCKVRPALR